MEIIKKKKEIEFPDAPSGFVTLYNYKEPFMDFKYEGEGYGYEGVLLFDGNTDKVQCHFCGEWFDFLVPHISREHNLKADRYKEIVGLRKNSALISETHRLKLIQNGYRTYKNLKPGKLTQESKAKISRSLREAYQARETQNTRGTCPLQLLDRLEKKANELGRCPTYDEVTFVKSLVKVYGSYSNACRRAGLTPNQQHYPIKGKEAYRLTKEDYSPSQLLDALRDFKLSNGREPSNSDFNRELLPKKQYYRLNFGSFKKALEFIRMTDPLPCQEKNLLKTA